MDLNIVKFTRSLDGRDIVFEGVGVDEFEDPSVIINYSLRTFEVNGVAIEPDDDPSDTVPVHINGVFLGDANDDTLEGECDVYACRRIILSKWTPSPPKPQPPRPPKDPRPPIEFPDHDATLEEIRAYEAWYDEGVAKGYRGFTGGGSPVLRDRKQNPDTNGYACICRHKNGKYLVVGSVRQIHHCFDFKIEDSRDIVLERLSRDYECDSLEAAIQLADKMTNEYEPMVVRFLNWTYLSAKSGDAKATLKAKYRTWKQNVRTEKADYPGGLDVQC